MLTADMFELAPKQPTGKETGMEIIDESQSDIESLNEESNVILNRPVSYLCVADSIQPTFQKPSLKSLEGKTFVTSIARAILKTKDEEEKEVTFEGTDDSELTFNTQIFWQELFIHLTLPFSAPLLLWRGGRLALINRDLWHFDENYSNLLMLGGTYMIMTLFYLLVILSFLFRQSIFKEEGMQANFWWSTYLMCIRSAAIALKHAYRSDHYIKHLNVKQFSSGFKRSDELLFGWLRFDKQAVFRYMTEVEQVVPHDRNRLFVLRGCLKDQLPFFFPYASQEYPNWERQVCSHNSVHADELLIPVGMITMELLLRESQEKPSVLRNLIFLLIRGFVAFSHVFVIIAVRAEMNIPIMGSTCIEILTQSIFLFITFTISFMFIGPMGIAIAVHFRRQYEWSAAICLLLKEKNRQNVRDETFRTQRFEDDLSLPLIGIRHNIINWLLLRCIVRNIGAKFHKRTNGMISGMLSFCICLCLCYVWWFLSMEFSCQSCFQLQLLFLFVVHSLFIFFVLGVAVYYGSKANEIPEKELALLNAHKLKLVSVLCESSNTGNTRTLADKVILESTILDQITQSIATNAQSDSVYLLGAKMSSGLLLGICSILLSGLLTILDLTAFSQHSDSEKWC